MTQKETNRHVQDQIDLLERHASVANEEMGVIKNDIVWIKGVLEKLEGRTWVIISGIILNLLVAIAFQLWK